MVALHLPKLAGVLFGSLCAAGLLSWRFHLGIWEAWHCLCQTALFMLGCWLLSGDNATSTSAQRLLSKVCVAFTSFWLLQYVHVALITANPPAEYGALLGNTKLAYLHFCMAAAEAMFMQTVWHRLVPGWACTLLGTGQALLHARGRYRYSGWQHPTAWQVLRLTVMSLLGFLGPYQVSGMWARRRSSQIAAEPAGGKDEDRTSAKQVKARSMGHSDGQQAAESRGIAASVDSNGADLNGSAGASTASPSCTHAQDMDRASWKNATDLVAVLSQTAYKPLTVTRTVCLKLDTDLPCSSLPVDIVNRLQRVMLHNTGQTMPLTISDVAVRPGCICISIKTIQQVAQGTDQLADAALRADLLAGALLSDLQDVLKDSSRGSGLKRGMLQIGSTRVLCTWCELKQTWEFSVQGAVRMEQAASTPWLGVATSSELRPATAVHGELADSHHRNGFEMLAEMQLWGISKALEVEGWNVPQEHQACAYTQQHWFDQRTGRQFPYKLLARLGDGYLPTQVVRLVPGSTDGYVTAQVLVQLHEHQLVRHHEGGSPSTLLVMDLELWQNEVLLSSSPLLSLPAAGPIQEGGSPTPRAWWWGAADSTVAAAVAELQSCAQQCLLLSDETEAASDTTAYNKYVQDVAIWLDQVQRVSCTSGMCCVSSVPSAHSMFQQPTLSHDLLQKLGHSVMQYAAGMQWPHMQQMVAQQLQYIKQPAAGLRSRAHVYQPLLQGARTVVLGYPCHHDEQLYKQRLAGYLQGLSFLSSSATAMICMLWGVRTLLSGVVQVHTWFMLGWFLLHMAALSTVLLRHMGKLGRLGITGVNATRACSALVYMYRVLTHAGLTLTTSQDVRSIPTPLAWAATHLLLILTEQVPASQVLPAPWMFAFSLLEFSCQVLLIMQAYNWHSATCLGAAFLLVVCVRLVLDAYLRQRLRKPARATGNQRMLQHVHAKLN